MNQLFPARFLTAVLENFPKDFMSRAPEDLEEYGKDWTRVYPPAPSAVVFPRTTDEVARFVRLCTEHKVAVVPSGGRTGLAGGAVAARGEIVLSLSKMNRMDPVDPVAQTVRVQAGAVTEAVHQHCAPQGLIWPVDFAAKGSSHIGGNISTNAGGVRGIQYGSTRQWVLGLQVVTMSGDVLELNGALEKNNTGIDLKHLFIGSEGILGIITEATLKLTRIPGALDLFFFAVEDMAAVLRLFHHVRKAPFGIMAFETMTHNCLEVVTQSLGLKFPVEQRSGAYVLFEAIRPASTDAQQIMDAWLEELFEKQLVLDGTLAQSPREARELWMMREGIAESLFKKAFLHKNDVSVPISEQDDFVNKMFQMFSSRHSDLEVYMWGHIGDGNLHINTLMPSGMSRDEFLKRCHDADQDLFTLVQEFHGSVSAEHGVGLLKKDALHFSRTPQEIALFKAIKKAFDPDGLLNPGKIF